MIEQLNSDIDLSPIAGFADYIPNPVFSTLLNIRSKIILFTTGNRFGKSRSVSRAKGVYPILGACPFPDHNIKPGDKCRTIRFAAELLPEDKENEVKNTVYPFLKSQIANYFIKKDITARVPVVTVQPLMGGAPAHLEFVSYGQSIQAQAGVERRAICPDEVCPYEFYEESMPRLATTNGQFVAGCTPVDAGWMYTELYERARTYIRTPKVIERFKSQHGQTFKTVEKTDSKSDITVLQAATDDNPIWEGLILKKKEEIKKGITLIEDFPFDTVSEYLDSVFMYADPAVVSMRRYGIFAQISGAVHKEFSWAVHMIDGKRYFPNGMPKDGIFARSIDYHQSVPWAIIFCYLSEDDELFIWDEMNPDPHDFTTFSICKEMMSKSLDHKFRVNLIDKLANEIQTNALTSNRTATDEINSILREHGRLSYDKDTAFTSWDDKTTLGEDRVRERLINAKLCGRPFNNDQMVNGKKTRIPTMWIFDSCLEMGKSLKSWKMETWIDRDSVVTKDPKDKKESKWSHFNMALECLLKDSRFKVNNYTYAPREQFDKATYFHGGR